MKQIEPSYRGSRWSQWSLHDSGLYYYRARYISLEDISSIRPTGRDWFVPNVRGGYIHYESRAVSEAAIQSPSIQTPEFSTCSITTTTATNDSPAASSQTTDEIVAEASSRDSMLMSGALQTEADVTEAVIIMSRPAQLKRTSTTPKKQKDKKHGKKVDVDKRKTTGRINSFSTSPAHLLAQPPSLANFQDIPSSSSASASHTRDKLDTHATAIMTSTIGIPIKLLNEAQGHIVTLEITSGQTYRGKLLDAEDNMNVQLKDITVTARDGRVSHLDQVYIRGSHVRFFIVPDMLRNAPMFRSRNVRGRGVGLARGRATVSRARAGGRGGR
ncbi:small nuclear ribonucleo d3 [Fusarium longipes]|uniref:Small nuclear ribonucleo d3 n=1 Tax=Fusarium longipes TaxID=694270 RepID=A0A395SZZ7_9HYPO|nr:small nuclear ribonucleo d3 [Fusarium longipes]